MSANFRSPRAKKQVEGAPRRMDIRTIARIANVSISTVSRTINRLATVNPKIAKRVWEVIEELDYFPNTQARALVSGRSRILGLIVSEITNPFFPELIQGFEEIAIEHGYEILISSTNYDPKRMSHCIRRMLERNVDGVAVMTFGIEEPLLQQFAQRNIPLGKLLEQRFFDAESHDGDAIHITFQHPANAMRHAFRIVVGRTYQNLIAVLDGNLFKALDQLWKEWIRYFRDNKAKYPTAPRHERPGLRVRKIVEFFDDFPDPFCNLRID